MSQFANETFLPIGRKTEISANTLGISRLIKNLISSVGEKTIYSFTAEGYTNKSIETICQELTSKGASVVNENFNKPTLSYIFGWKDKADSYLEVLASASDASSKDTYVSVNLLTNDIDLFLYSKEYFKDLELVKTDNTGYVFSIVRGPEGQLTFGRLGFAGIKLERENYTSKVLEDYDFVVQDLKSRTPSGGIVILEGQPGCGKTYLTRGLFMDVENAMFVIVPASTVASLTGPELLPLLINQKDIYGTRGPIILVLEDADQCLVPRSSDNISSISTLLNLGDGICGSLMDIRIIATTNAKQEKMDKAILRDGRLSKRIEVTSIDYNKANAIFSRLTDQKDKVLTPKDSRTGFSFREKSEYTLAEVYKLARNNGWLPPKTKEQSSVEQSHSSPFWRD